MQDALNSLTKARLLIIDNLEILDNENKDLFMDLVEEISQNYDTVLIALTTEDLIMLPNMKVFRWKVCSNRNALKNGSKRAFYRELSLVDVYVLK